MAVFLPQLKHGYAVDQAILYEEERLVLIRFGEPQRAECMQQDEVLFKVAERVRLMAVVYLVDIGEVPDFNKLYELSGPSTLMFFFRNKHMLVDLHTGDNNKISFLIGDKQQLIDIIECVYLAARKGKGLAETPYNFAASAKRFTSKRI